MSPLNAIHPALSDSLRSVFQFPRVERLHIWSYILKFPATSIIPVLSLCLPGYCVHPVMGIYCSSTEESCAASRSVLKCLFYATAFYWNSWLLCIILLFFFLIFFLHIFTPQVWRNRTDEFFPQHTAGTESQGHHAHNRLDSDLGFACRSTGTVVSSWARLPWLFISISSLISNQLFKQPS